MPRQPRVVKTTRYSITSLRDEDPKRPSLREALSCENEAVCDGSRRLGEGLSAFSLRRRVLGEAGAAFFRHRRALVEAVRVFLNRLRATRGSGVCFFKVPPGGRERGDRLLRGRHKRRARGSRRPDGSPFRCGHRSATWSGARTGPPRSLSWRGEPGWVRPRFVRRFRALAGPAWARLESRLCCLAQSHPPSRRGLSDPSDLRFACGGSWLGARCVYGRKPGGHR